MLLAFLPQRRRKRDSPPARSPFVSKPRNALYAALTAKRRCEFYPIAGVLDLPKKSTADRAALLPLQDRRHTGSSRECAGGASVGLVVLARWLITDALPVAVAELSLIQKDPAAFGAPLREND